VTIRLLVVGFASLTLGLVASGCGGSEAPSFSAESQSAIQKIQEICTDTSAKVDDVQGEFPVGGFDPNDPNPADLPAVGDYFAIAHPYWDEALAQAQQIQVPDEIEPKVDALFAAVAKDLAIAKSQTVAARASDVPAFKATLLKVDASRTAVKDASDELGITCQY
jgi:hypothetical protein